ncbi:MAG: ROK family transcriptional regulator [Anaerolineae bacterium]|nr:ROK family transcriptional regulator [Anaerolineae bacterium]
MARRQLLKTINRAAILNVIRSHGAIARTDIAELTGLSPAAVTGLTAELIEDGLVVAKQEGASRGGRRPILLALNTQGACVVGIKLAEEHATLALTDLNAEIITKRTVLLADRTPQAVSRLLAEGVRELLDAADVRRNRLLGVGVGLAGIIDSQAGLCRISPHNGWREVPFAKLLEEELDCIVHLDNNVNTLTRVEQLYGLGRQVRDFLVVTIGRGVGMGIVANGQVYRGTRGGGGEFGHMVVDPAGFVCGCGNRGCLETFVAEPWLLHRARLRGLDVATPEALVAAAQAGDSIARDVLAEGGRVLGCAIASAVNLLNPALILISGEGLRAGDFLLAPMREAAQEHMFGPLAEDVVIRVESLSDDTWARGAASLVLGRIFSMPELA